MSKLYIFFILLTFSATKVKAQKERKVDSIQVKVSFPVKDKRIELSKNFWESYFSLPVKLKMYGFKDGNPKHLYRTFDMKYNPEIDAWTATVPSGYFELNVETLFRFSDINFPLRLKADFEESFTLGVDSLVHTYRNRKMYHYIEGTLNFNETLVVDFNTEDYATNRAFLDEALDIEGLEHISVRRAYKIRGRNTFVVTLDIWDTQSLETILYNKLAKKEEIERGYLIGKYITKAIELYQANPDVNFANPSFLNNKEKEFRKSDSYTKSEKLEYKLQTLMEEDEQTLQKINYIIEKTTPKKKEEEEEKE